jgi:hypothetical protein
MSLLDFLWVWAINTVGGGFCIYLIYYFGLITRILQNGWVQRQLFGFVSSKSLVNLGLSLYTNASKSNASSASSIDCKMEICESRKAAKITFPNPNGSESKCHVFVPYNSRLVGKMMRRKVYLLKDSREIDITQYPGVPYLVNPSQLGGVNAVVYDSEDTSYYKHTDSQSCITVE